MTIPIPLPDRAKRIAGISSKLVRDKIAPVKFEVNIAYRINMNSLSYENKRLMNNIADVQYILLLCFGRLESARDVPGIAPAVNK